MYDPQTTVLNIQQFFDNLQGLFSSGLTTMAPFPAFSITFSLGNEFLELIQVSTLHLQMTASTSAQNLTTMNIIGNKKL